MDARHDKTCQVWTVERVSGGEEAGEGKNKKVPELFQFRDFSLDFGYLRHMLIFVLFNENPQYFH